MTAPRRPDVLKAAGPCGATRKTCTCGHHARTHGPDRRGRCLECACKGYTAAKCKQPGSGTGGRCRYHGGNAPIGADTSQFIHGRRSRYGLVVAGSALQRFYEAAISDPEQLTLRSEIALTEARIAEALDRLTRADAGDWRAAAAAFADLQRAIRAGNRDAAAGATARLHAELTAGAAASTVAAALSDLTDLKRRLVEGQARVARDTFQTIALGHVATFVAQVADLIRRTVTNETEVATVVRGLSELLGPRTDPPTDPGDHGAAGAARPAG
jgi:hypothetical protein